MELGALLLRLHVFHQPEIPESFSKRTEEVLHLFLFYFISFFFFLNVSHIQEKAGACISPINGMAGSRPTTTYL